MKKFLIALTVLTIFMTGCGRPITDNFSSDTGTRFVKISREYGCDVVYDSETGVEYVTSRCAYNIGTYTLLVNADGTPKIYKGWEK